MKKNAMRVGLAALVLAGLAAGLVYGLRPKPIVVKIAQVERGAVEATLANTRAGSVEACQRTKLATIVGGRIDYLGVKEGERVQKGQVLMRLWHEDLAARVAVAEAQLATMESRRQEMCTLAANAEREAARQERLAAQGFVASAKADAARTEALARRTACQSAEREVATAFRQLAAARADLSRTVIIAPFAGTVAKIVGEIGEYSTPSPPGVPTPPAIDLIDDSCLYVKAPMDELDAPKIKPGLPVRIRVDAMGEKVFAGRVRRIAPYVTALEKQARTVDVEAEFLDPAEAKGLLVGYSADLEIVLATKEAVLRIPTAALKEGKRVYAVDASGRVVEKKIETGLANWQWTEVVAGLAEGERIVLSLERTGVKPGAYVIAEESGNASSWR
ncbi:MAG: efflux RND transporter periplasmic adaptor subunit [Rhodocyclaceae bacterium]|nr:efflux RND transporter periplasmic adaptor subunit [Rhodocyclaceae bacterium]